MTPGPTAAQPPAPLNTFIDARLASAPFNRAVWAVRVEEQDGTVLYDRNGSVMMTPASNRKLFVAAAAADCWGFSKTFDTEILLEGAVTAGVLEGDLIVRGGGDPSLGGRLESDRDRPLLPILSALRAAGITRIAGGVVADVSRFDGQLFIPSWEFEDIGSTNASPVDALTFNEGNIGVRVTGCDSNGVTTDPSFPEARSVVTCGDSTGIAVTTDALNRVSARGTAVVNASKPGYDDVISVSDPALYAVQAIDEFLSRKGIATGRSPAVSRVARGTLPIARLSSQPLAMLLTTYLEDSVNLYGDMLLKNLSAERSGKGSFAAGIGLERQFLTATARLDPADFEFVDGSGLSTRNKVTAVALIRLLRTMEEGANRGFFEEALASPGDSGTMSKRLIELRGRLYTKSGTLTGVSTLSGFVRGSQGRVRYFSIMANNMPSSLSIREGVNQMVRRIADF